MPITTGGGFTPARFAVELNGAHVGFAQSVSGGEPFAVVMENAPVGTTADKHLGPRRYEPLVIEFGGSMDAAWYRAIDAMLAGSGGSFDGAVVMLDNHLVVGQRLAWTAGVITEVRFPEARAASRSAGTMQVVIRPGSTSLTSGGGAFVTAPSSGEHQPPWLLSNFRFMITGLESACARVSTVNAITVRRGEDSVVRVDDVECSLSTLDAAPFRTWFEGLVAGTATERTGVLTFFDPSLQERMHLELGGLGTFRVANERLEAGTETIARTHVHLYCEKVAWTRSAIDGLLVR